MRLKEEKMTGMQRKKGRWQGDFYHQSQFKDLGGHGTGTEERKREVIGWKARRKGRGAQ